MAEKCVDLPEECWEMIFKLLDNHRHLEPLSLVCKRFFSITNFLRHTLKVTVTYPNLPFLLQRFRNLKKIHLPQYLENLHQFLLQIAQSNLNLEALSISNQENVPVLGLRELGFKMMRSLKILHCSKMRSLQDSDLIAIAGSLPWLEELDISYPENSLSISPVTDKGISVLALKLGNLRKINLSGNQFITDQSLVSLSLNCVLLSEISVCDCGFITPKGIGVAIRHAPNLVSISANEIGFPSLDSNLKESFAYGRALCAIDLTNSFISDHLLYSIAEACLPLKKLVLSQCHNFTFCGISLLLYKYQNIQHLDLEGINFLTDQAISTLSKFLSKLTSINLSLCSELTNLSFFSLTSNCPLLSEIRMKRTNIGEEDCATDSAINPQVKLLDLAENCNLNDDCIKKFVLICPNLKVLNLNNCSSITGEGIVEILKSCHEIGHLQMNQCGGMKNSMIDSEFPKLEVLRAKVSGIDDEALAVIGNRCRGLLRLDLEGCLNVTASGVKEVVGNCRALKEINLKWCANVEVDIVAWMVFSRPSLRNIVPPPGFVSTKSQRNFFLRHGCLVRDY